MGGPPSGGRSGVPRLKLVKAVDREILRLAVPAFLALVAEPLFLLSDAAIVGHLGTPQLAGLGIAAVILQTVVGLCVFLAYGTTASVARHLGAGDLRAALAQGVDGIWLAVIIGAIATVLGVVGTPALVGAFGTGAEVAGHAETYLAIAFLGTTPLLIMLAATGVLRGLQDTRTPLLVAVVGNGVNIALNLLLVYGLDLGIAGSAIGSVIAQVVSAGWLVAVVVRASREQGAPLTPDLARHPRRRPRRRRPRHPDARAARLPARRDVRRHPRRHGRARRHRRHPPGRDHPLVVPRLRPRRHRDRRAGPHRAARSAAATSRPPAG